MSDYGMPLFHGTPYQQDMLTRVVDLVFERATFLARPSVMFGLVPFLDGNQWSVLYGPNLQVGIAGFGDSPDKAMADFDRAWKEENDERTGDEAEPA